MNWNMTKLSFAAACAMALATTPALAYGPNGNWNGSENGQYGYRNNGNSDNGSRNGDYGYNQYNRRGFANREGRYQNYPSGYNNENGWNNGNGRYGYNRYNRGEMNGRDGYNNRREGDGNQYGYNAYNGNEGAGRSGGGYVHYNYRPGGPTSYWERGHACYSISCER